MHLLVKHQRILTELLNPGSPPGRGHRPFLEGGTSTCDFAKISPKRPEIGVILDRRGGARTGGHVLDHATDKNQSN